MATFHVHYYYFCVPGMELGPDEADLGLVEADSAAEALQQVAEREVPNPKPYCEGATDRDWYRGCLRVVDQAGVVTHGHMFETRD